MEVLVHKCEYCGFIIESKTIFEKHYQVCSVVSSLKSKFNLVVVGSNATDFIQRDVEWYDSFRSEILKISKTLGFTREPFTYGWWRVLSDGGSKLYAPASILLEICTKCWKQYNQRYHADHCSCC